MSVLQRGFHSLRFAHLSFTKNSTNTLRLIWPFQEEYDKMTIISVILLTATWENLPWIRKQALCISFIPMPLEGGRDLIFLACGRTRIFVIQEVLLTKSISAHWDVAFNQGSWQTCQEVQLTTLFFDSRNDRFIWLDFIPSPVYSCFTACPLNHTYCLSYLWLHNKSPPNFYWSPLVV